MHLRRLCQPLEDIEMFTILFRVGIPYRKIFMFAVLFLAIRTIVKFHTHLFVMISQINECRIHDKTDLEEKTNNASQNQIK